MNIEMSSSARSGTGNCVKEYLKKFYYEKIKTPEFVRNCFLFVCVMALAIDPLFLFVPEIDYQKSCIGFDEKLGYAVGALRSYVDALCLLYIILSLTTYLRGKMSVRERLFYGIVDIVSALPIPQAMLWHFYRNKRSYYLVSKRMLKWIIVGQYIPRIYRIFPIYKEATKTSVTVVRSKWIGALINLLLFLLCSYVFGAFWYVTAIEKQSICWHDYWNQTTNDFGSGTRWEQVNITELYCAHVKSNTRFLKDSCPVIDPAIIGKTYKKLAGHKKIYEYDFGMYRDVVESQVGSANPRDFPKKFFYCFWWALGNLSTFGENLKPGNSATDIFLAILMCACGLFLVAVLIGNVQKYLLSSTVRADEMNERKKDIETWTTYRQLPEELKKRIKENEKTIWKNSRGTDEEDLLRRLPEDLRRETQTYLDEHCA